MRFFSFFFLALAAVAMTVMAAPNMADVPYSNNMALAPRTSQGDYITISFDLKIIIETAKALESTLYKTGNFIERDLQFIGSSLIKLVKFVEDIVSCLGNGLLHFGEDAATALVQDFKKAEQTTEYVVKGLVEKVAEIKVLQYVEEDLVKLAKGVALLGKGLITRVPEVLVGETQAIIDAFEQILSVAVNAYSVNVTVGATA